MGCLLLLEWALLWSAELQGKAAMGGREDSLWNAGDLFLQGTWVNGWLFYMQETSTCECWLGCRRFMVLGNWRYFFSAYNEENMETPLQLQCCEVLTFFYVFQQPVSSFAPPFVFLMLKYIVKKYLDSHFNKSFKNLLYWLAINFCIFHIAWFRCMKK